MRRRLFASLALAQARKTEANSDRIECRPEGNLNRFIVSKLVEIHKAKARGRIEFIAFLFSGLRVIWGRILELVAATVESSERRRLYARFPAIGAVSARQQSACDDQMRMGITT
jgi:hypothetical protein